MVIKTEKADAEKSVPRMIRSPTRSEELRSEKSSTFTELLISLIFLRSTLPNYEFGELVIRLSDKILARQEYPVGPVSLAIYLRPATAVSAEVTCSGLSGTNSAFEVIASSFATKNSAKARTSARAAAALLT